MKRLTAGRATLRRTLLVAFLTACVIAGAAGPSAGQEQTDPVAPPKPGAVVRRDLLVVDDKGKALDGGGSSTPFRFVLEGEDECPGDSAHDQYRIDSYMVPVDVDPTKLRFTGLGPTPPNFREYAKFRMPVYKLSEDPYAAQQTSQQATPGGPGPIRELPPFGWGVYVPTLGIKDYKGGLPSGKYRIGLACTYAARITNLWETTVELKQDAADKPVGIAWVVTGPQPRDLESEATPIGADSGSGYAWFVSALVAFAAVMLITAVVLFRASKRGPDDGTPDDATLDDGVDDGGEAVEAVAQEPSPT